MRTTVYLDDDLHGRLRRLVPTRGLNRFIVQAIAERIALLERQQIEQEMKEGYLATRDEREALNADWAIADLEGWPE